jgi:hypothetical protein
MSLDFMVNKHFVVSVYFLLICFLSAFAQTDQIPQSKNEYKVDTLYFHYSNNIQMIAILNFTSWQRFIDHKESTQPRGLSWSAEIPPHSPNLYLFRDQQGKIIHSYHIAHPEKLKLRSTSYTTPSIQYMLPAQIEIAPNKYIVYENSKEPGPSDFRFSTKKGLINQEGTLILPYEYDDISELGIHLAVAKEGKYAIMNLQLELLTPFHFDEMPNTPLYNNNILEVRINQLLGFADLNGQILIPCKYESLSGNSIYDITGYMVMEKKLFGMLNTDLSIRIPTQYESIQVMKDCNKKTVFNVKQNGKHGILDKSGNILLQTVYDDIGYSCPYSISKAGKYGLFDASFKVLIPAAYDTIIKFKNIRARKDGKWAFFTEEGIPLSDGAIVDKMDWYFGYYIIQANGLYGLINELQANAETYIAPQYEALRAIHPDFSKKTRYFFVQKNEHWGILEATGNKEVVPLIYDQIKGVPFYRDSKLSPDGEKVYVRKKEGEWQEVILK